MARRWTHRPDGSTWGDWGDDDQLGRLNLLTPDKVLAGAREVTAGISFCLSLPLDVPGGRVLMHRRHPPRLFPTESATGEPEVFFNVHQSATDARFVDVWNDDEVTLSLQYSTQWDSLAHVGAEFDVDGDGVEKPVFYNGFRAHAHIAGPLADASGDGRHHVSYAHHLGIEHMAYHGIQGRGVLVDLAHHLGTDHQLVDLATLLDVARADSVTLEPGDILVLHTGFATELLAMDRHPDPARVHKMCAMLDARDDALLQWITDSQIAALAADNYAIEGVGLPEEDPTRHSFRPLHHHCLFKLGLPLAELWYLDELARWLRDHGRSRFLLTAPPLRLPGAVGSPVTPIATV